MYKIFRFMILASILASPNFQQALASNGPRVDTLEHYLEVTAHRKGRQLCEALLYHTKNGSDIASWTKAVLNDVPVNENMLNSQQWHNIREGSREWTALHFHAFTSKANQQFITELFGIGPIHHAGFFSLTTQYTLNLTRSEDFHKGIVYCAMTNEVDDPDMFAEGIKQIILEADQNAGKMGVLAGLAVDLTIVGGIFLGAIKVINIARQFFASTAFYRWIFQPRVITEIMRSPFRFLIRSIVNSKWRIATATASAALAIGYGHYQIRKDHLRYSQAQAQMIKPMLQNVSSAYAQNIAESEWPIRISSYQKNIISKLDQAEALANGSIERSNLETEISINLDHYLKDYYLIAMRLEGLREHFCSTGINDRNLEDQEYFLSEILEHLRVRKIKLEGELLDRQAERVASYEGYDRYQHLMVLFELMEVNRIRDAQEDYDREQYGHLLRENLRFKNIRLENLHHI